MKVSNSPLIQFCKQMKYLTYKKKSRYQLERMKRIIKERKKHEAGESQNNNEIIEATPQSRKFSTIGKYATHRLDARLESPVSPQQCKLALIISTTLRFV